MSVFIQYQENLLSLFVKAYFHFEKCEKLQAVLVYFVIFNFDGDSLDQGVKTFWCNKQFGDIPKQEFEPLNTLM